MRNGLIAGSVPRGPPCVNKADPLELNWLLDLLKLPFRFSSVLDKNRGFGFGFGYRKNTSPDDIRCITSITVKQCCNVC